MGACQFGRTLAGRKNVLVVITSHKVQSKGGYSSEQLVECISVLTSQGHSVQVASIRGGQSLPETAAPDSTASAAQRRLLIDTASSNILESARPISAVAASLGTRAKLDAVLLCGGAGALVDFPTSRALAAVVGRAFDDDAVVGALGEGVVGLVNAVNIQNTPVLEGRQVACSRHHAIAVPLTSDPVKPSRTVLDKKVRGSSSRDGGADMSVRMHRVSDVVERRGGFALTQSGVVMDGMLFTAQIDGSSRLLKSFLMAVGGALGRPLPQPAPVRASRGGAAGAGFDDTAESRRQNSTLKESKPKTKPDRPERAIEAGAAREMQAGEEEEDI